jgi:hypothetical protein
MKMAQFECSLREVDGYCCIYADGSKEEAAVAAAAIMDYVVLVKRLPDRASILSAEVRASFSP